jgi:hypothetical protein
MLAVIFLQSVQLQTKDVTRPGALVGCVVAGQFGSKHVGWWRSRTYEEKLYCTAKTCSCGFVVVSTADDALGRQRDVDVAHGDL